MFIAVFLELLKINAMRHKPIELVSTAPYMSVKGVAASQQVASHSAWHRILEKNCSFPSGATTLWMLPPTDSWPHFSITEAEPKL
jgi:hypothetical protein